MIKTIGTYILLAFYLIASTGFSASVHFCSESVAEIAVLSELSEKSCCCSTEEESNSCCQERTFEYKVDTKHLAQSAVSKSEQPLLNILAVNQPLVQVALIDNTQRQTSQFKKGQDPPLRILNCTYRL